MYDTLVPLSLLLAPVFKREIDPFMALAAARIIR